MGLAGGKGGWWRSEIFLSSVFSCFLVLFLGILIDSGE